MNHIKPFIKHLMVMLTCGLLIATRVFAEPHLIIDKTSNTLAISSDAPESTVYVRIGWPNGKIEELTQAEFVEWHPPIMAPDGQYRFDCYTYQDIPQGEMSKQDWERTLENYSAQRSGMFTIQDGDIILDTAQQNTIPPIKLGPQSHLNSSTVLLNALRLVLDALIPAANAANVTVSSVLPRIDFEDTTIADGLDWQITTSQLNDGSSTFRLFDYLDLNLRLVIDIVGGLNNTNSLIVNSAGDISLANNTVYLDRSANTMGIGTTTPNGSLHILDSASPEIILQDTGGPAFELEASTFEIGIKENFGSTIFAVQSGALPDSLVIDSTSNIGMGIDDPGALVSNTGQPASLHIVKSNGNASVLIEENNPIESFFNVQLEIRNNGTAQFALIDESANGGDWRFQNFEDTFRVTAAGTGAGEMTLERTGNVTFRGTVSANGGSSTFPDYVFEPSYKLMPLNDLQAFIGENKHLPNIPSKQEIESKGNVINMTELQYKLLEKVEELTLYTLNQQKTIEQLTKNALEQQRKIDLLLVKLN